MARGFSGAMMRAFGAGEWLFTVTAVEDVTGHYRRITFHAPGYFDGPDFGPASYVRFWMPDVDDPERQHQRAYTILDPDPATETLTIEVVLHTPSGPASAWAARAEVGDVVAATKWGVPRFEAPTPPPAGYLLVGDPAALPGINGILEVLPYDVPVAVHLEYTHEDERTLPVAAHPNVTFTWVRRTGEANLLAETLPLRDYSDWFAWVTAEAGATRAVVNRLKEWGFPKSAVKSQAYWKQGKAMGKSRGEEDLPAEETAAAAETAPAGETAPAEQPTAAAFTWRTRAGTELIAPLRGRLWLAAAAQALVSLLQLAPFVLLAELCVRVLSGRADPAGLLTLGYWAIGLAIAGTLLATALLVALHTMDARFGHDVRRQLVDRLGRLPLGWFSQRSSGLVKTAADDDATSLHYLVTHAVLDLTAAVVTPVAVLVYLFTVHPGLAGVLLLPLLLLYVLSMRMYSASSYGSPIFESLRDRITAEAVTFLDGISVSRVYERGDDATLGRTLAERGTFLNHWQRPLVGQKTVIDLVTRPTTSLLLVTTAGTLFVIAGWATVDDLVPFLLVGVTFGAQLMAIAYGATAMKESMDAARRIGMVLTEPELATPPQPATVAAGQHTVRFESVGFGYSPQRRVLSDFELTLPPGSTTALVGPSGSGKSTIAALLARFHDVDAGRITIDGVDVRDLTQAGLYAAVGFVFQGGSLVHASLHDNIALGRPDATREQVEEAARAAQVHERITRLDRGYDAVVGEDARLSGGEEQRVAIARLLLADPPILVLDEATSYADPESEHLVQQALTALIADRTVLVIAHRLHTVTGADQIVVLDEGSIVQQGRHAELVDREGLYRSLWTTGRTLPAEVPA